MTSLIFLWNYLLGTLWLTSYMHVYMEKPGVSLDLKRIQKMSGNYLQIFDISQDKKRNQIHPQLLQTTTLKAVSGLFREQTYLSFLESKAPGNGTVALQGRKFSVPGSFQSLVA